MQDSRDSLGLHLKGSIIVVDEAHNLVDAVNSAHCAEVSVQQLSAAEAQLSAYFERFRTRLAAGLLFTIHTPGETCTVTSLGLLPQVTVAVGSGALHKL